MTNIFDYNAQYGRGNGERKFGWNLDVGTSFETIWSVGGTYVWPTAEDSCVVTSSGDDNSSGSGARTIRIFYLDGNYAEKTTDVTLNGSTVTTSVDDIFRINRAIVLTSGTAKAANANNINITHTGTGDTLARIPLLHGITKQLVYTCPAGRDVYIEDVHFSIDGTKTADVKGLYSVGSGPAIIVGDLYGISGYTEVHLEVPVKLPRHADFEIQAKVDTTAVEMTADTYLRLI